jgi:hypothetical protein
MCSSLRFLQTGLQDTAAGEGCGKKTLKDRCCRVHLSFCRAESPGGECSTNTALFSRSDFSEVQGNVTEDANDLVTGSWQLAAV